MCTQIRGVAAAVAMTLATATPAGFAQENAWGFEITPYLWTVGVDADVKVRGREAEVDLKFDDLIDRVDVAGSLLGLAYRDHLVVWTQLDYLSTDSNELDVEDRPLGEDARFESEMFIGTLALGYRFGEPNGRRNIDVLLGARYTELEAELSLETAGRFKRKRDYIDPVLLARPSFRISERWRFNPTFGIGGGNDADLLWELQPQIQFNINDNLALRFGYRNLYYDMESDDEQNAFDGSFKGFILGLGGTFGNRPYYLSKKTDPASATAAAQ